MVSKTIRAQHLHPRLDLSSIFIASGFFLMTLAIGVAHWRHRLSFATSYHLNIGTAFPTTFFANAHTRWLVLDEVWSRNLKEYRGLLAPGVS